MSGTRIVIADDHPLVRGAVRHTIEGALAPCHIIECDDLQAVDCNLSKYKVVDLVLLDLTMPDVRDFSGLIYLRAKYPQVPVAIISARAGDESVYKAFDFGAVGFIPKTSDIETMRKAVCEVLAGATWAPSDVDFSKRTGGPSVETVDHLSMLTPQQLRVLMMVSNGLTNKQIALELSLSEATVKAHMNVVLKKLNVDNRTQAVILASKLKSA